MHAFLIHNPISGKPERHDALQRAIGELHAAGWRLDIHVTTRRGHVRDLAEQAVRDGHRRIIIVGGDGSIGQAADGIIRAGATDVSLGVIPLGTGNVFARDVGLPYPRRNGYHSTVQAARVILADDAIPLDVGLAKGHAFLCWAGCGIDAVVAEQVEQGLVHNKRQRPVATYVASLLRDLQYYHPCATRIIADDDILEGRFFLTVASNIALYARYFPLAPFARLNDGYLDLIIIAEPDAARFLFRTLKLLTFPTTHDSRIIHRPIQRLQVTTETPLPFHIDGDPLGLTPFTVDILPRRLPIYLDRARAAPRLLAPPSTRDS